MFKRPPAIRAVSQLEADVASLERSLSRGSLLNALLEISPSSVVVTVVLVIGASVSGVLTPSVFSRIVHWAQAPHPDFRIGVLYVAALVLTAGLGRVSVAYFNSLSSTVGARLCDAVRSLILRRVIYSRLAASGQGGAGEKHNLVTVDAHALEGLLCGGVSAIILPLEAVSLLVFLWFDISWAALVALAIALIIYLVNLLLSRRMREGLGEQATVADTRVNEVLVALAASSLLKQSALEPVFEATVAALRKTESQALQRVGGLFALNYQFSTMADQIIAIAIFTVFVKAMNRTLDQVGFTVLATLNVLFGIQSSLPLRIKQLDLALAAVTRIDVFLRSTGASGPESSGSAGFTDEGDPGSIRMTDAAFAWRAPVNTSVGTSTTSELSATAMEPVLRGVNLSIPAGHFMVVVGGVGAGKSALLHALLGELHLIEGAVTIGRSKGGSSSCAWVPQTPWIWAGVSIRDNIILDQPWDAVRYAEVLRVTELGDDLLLQADGDRTLVSDSTLSTGQKQRVSLARAAYSSSPLVLIDDCLASLDASVAASVLQKCILGFMSDRTRVVATSMPAAAASCDSLCVVRRSVSDNDAGATVEVYPRSDAPSEYVGFIIRSSSKLILSSSSSTHSISSADTTMQHYRDNVQPPNPLAHAAVPSISSVTAPPRALSPSQRPIRMLPFAYAWELAVGGRFSAAIFFTFMVTNCVLAFAGYYWLMLWTGDPQYTMATLDTYLGVYGALAGANIATIMLRIYALSLGIGASNDAMHKSLMFRLLHATQSYFSRTPLSTVANIIGDKLSDLDVNSLFPANYFWAMLLQVLQGIIGQLLVSPWLFIPVVVLIPIFVVFAIESKAADVVNASDTPQQTPLAVNAAPVNPQHHAANYATGRARFRGSRIGSGVSYETEPSESDSRVLVEVIEGDREVSAKPRVVTPPPITNPAASAVDTRAHLDKFFDMCVEASVSLRAYGATAYAIRSHADLIASFQASCSQENVNTWREKEQGAIIAALFYSLTTAVAVALRSSDPGPGLPPGIRGSLFLPNGAVTYGQGISASEASLIIFRGLHVSTLMPFILEALASLRAQALKRSTLVWALGTIPQEPIVAGTDDAVRSAQIDAAYGPAFELMGGVRTQPATPAPAFAPDWPTAGHLEIRDLQVSYDGSSDVSTSAGEATLALRGVTLEVRPGSWVSVVGRTGAGKSTLVAAIARIVERCGGFILLDGVDVQSVHLQRLRRAIGFASHDTFILRGSLRKNVDPFAKHSDAAILRALRRLGWQFDQPAADVAATAVAMDGESDSLLTPASAAEEQALSAPLDRGRLSAGQRALIGLARVLVDVPRLVVLDEAYSALDPDAEVAVHAAVKAAFADCAVLQVSHRLASVVDSDTVYVLGSGAVVECGSPKELLERGGAFRELVDSVPESLRNTLLAKVFGPSAVGYELEVVVSSSRCV